MLQGPGVSRIEIQPRQCSLTKIIQSSIDAVQAFAERHNVRLEGLDYQVSAYGDADRIVQVLVNMLSNAIKFSQSGSSVTITALPVDGQVEVRVADTGRGIPAHLKDAVFEKFQQVSTTDATEKGGTGLGLPICKEIIELHGGKIGVDSEEGKGSTFWFRMPAKPPSEA
jgi:signal transduction histidine kinase